MLSIFMEKLVVLVRKRIEWPFPLQQTFSFIKGHYTSALKQMVKLYSNNSGKNEKREIRQGVLFSEKFLDCE